ncbi:hypothetical protein BTURTLESOX_2177 [bacterium endosymbiont of Bathymodiolus sp. 5 South]|nr:hypothetical protein [uncultured Gammaproteobacteria bacterium]SHN93937.1 hypothetical protein BCLUESOX_1267 [bacterium endosymbiont of Bathymodiolus sp. 5 South]SSC08225.1 hypothetical protein BTURTLESOX_2177 [bacterium endosymbiont of Bathymodiolus sp. 5 South]VVH56720.1 hypothetical protein BSPCLSOX_2746 [uncultured Gammaproteobacteria bacterium]
MFFKLLIFIVFYHKYGAFLLFFGFDCGFGVWMVLFLDLGKKF